MQESKAVEYRGHKIVSYYDPEPMNPRTEWDNFGTMICLHKKYSLGDEGHGMNSGDFDSWEEMKSWLEKERDAVVILPLYLYDHSGITMNTGGFSCRWDSGQVGFIYVSRDTILEEFNRKRLSKNMIARATEILENEVKVYDQYLRGEVYGFQVEGPECHDSVWGFYGDEAYMIEEAKGCIDASIKQLEFTM